MKRLAFILVWLVADFGLAEIERPSDAPAPLTPEESAKRVQLPPGYRLELLASEPVVVQPSGICWDARGRIFVSELHGYNLEGQYDIEELNKSGELDQVVRRISAPPEAVARAERDQHGVVKRLIDTDGDGRMDEAEVWADDLPPCIGICPARDGVIVACAPDIIFLADRDGDGKAEIRETLFTGFAMGPVERRINTPRWGPDNWIYVGRGKRCRVTGPKLRGPIDLPGTDFRIKPDGSAIEPITGGTHTIGYAFTESGRRFTATTSSPGRWVAPIDWHYLARNPDLNPGQLESNAAGYRECYSIGDPHPWRTRREKDPGFFKYYRDRYGPAESEADGWFTGACSPLVYRDGAMPELLGHYFVCEPAVNTIHRALIHEGPKLVRHPSEQTSEFLSSSDIWFHPIALNHAPDGSIAIVDFYREIIEDYSAIPRYLQQQYGLDHGKNHGRIWRLVHKDMQPGPGSKIADWEEPRLVRALGSPHFWHRQTARRILVERGDLSKAGSRILLTSFIADPDHSVAGVNALQTLHDLNALTEMDQLAGLRHAAPDVRIKALRVAESTWLDKSETVDGQIFSMASDPNHRVRLQLALTLGEHADDEALKALARLANDPADWLAVAIRSSIYGREPTFRQMLGDAPLARELAKWIDEQVTETPAVPRPDPVPLMAAFPSATPKERTEILDRLFAHPDDYPQLLSALEDKTLPVSAISAVHRKLLLEHNIKRTKPLFALPDDFEATYNRFATALAQAPEPKRGKDLFRQHCATCHQVRGVGTDIGPNLTGENQRAPETMIKDVLAPSSEITAGFATYIVETKNDGVKVGLLVQESPGTISLKDIAGVTRTFKRKDVASLRTMEVSLMPEGLHQLLTPKDLADIIGWLRQ